jgi:hypothetical protein
LLVFKDFQAFPKRELATARNASMRGVGTKMGTVLSCDLQSLSQANIRTSGQHGTYKTYKTRPTCSIALGPPLRSWRASSRISR